MNSHVDEAIRWTKQAPAAARPLRELMLCHPRIVSLLKTFLGATANVLQADSERISIDMGDRGFDITAEGVEPWRRVSYAADEPEDWREWSEVQAPWEAQTATGTTLWSVALDAFDTLVRRGDVELVGRFDSLRSPANYIPPGGIPADVWLTPRVNFRDGSLVLSNGEIVYNVHIVQVEQTSTSRPNATLTKANGVDRLAAVIEDLVKASQSRRTHTKHQLEAEARRVKCAIRDIPKARKKALASFPESTQRAWGSGRSKKT